jgi:hypothetical protein
LSNRNYKRSAGSSFCPRTSGLSESERQEVIMSRVDKGKHYAGLGLAARTATQWKEVQPRMTEEEREAQKASLRRKAVIAAAVEKVQG